MPHLLLQLENAVHERLSGGRASRYVDIDGHNPVASSCDRVAVVVVSSSVRAAAHGDDPSRVGHLVVHLSQRRGHLVCEGSGDNHDIRLTGRGTENDTETILVVSWGGQVHHLDGAAGKTEGHGPERALAGPVGDLVEGGPTHGISPCRHSISRQHFSHAVECSHVQRVLHGALLSLLAGQWHFAARLLHRGRCSRVARDGGGALHRRRIVGRARGEEGSASGAEWQQRCCGFGCPEISSRATESFRGGGNSPRRAIEAPYRVVDSMLATGMKERVWWRSGEAGVGWRLGSAVAMKSMIVLRQASISSPFWAPSDRLAWVASFTIASRSAGEHHRSRIKP